MEDNVFEIELQKSQLLGFGFSIIGGAGSDLPPVIFDIVAKSPADICGKLETGDAIVAVNGHEVAALSTTEVVEYLKLSGTTLNLLIKRDIGIKHKAERFLYCAEDIDLLRDAISPRDLRGVDAVVVRHPTSPRPKPRASVILSSKALSPDTSKPKASQLPTLPDGLTWPHSSTFGKMEGEADVQAAAPRSKLPLYTMKPCRENGLDYRHQQKQKEPPIPDKTPPATRKAEGRRYETFLMTGDMMIQTDKQASKEKTLTSTNGVTSPKKTVKKTPEVSRKIPDVSKKTPEVSRKTSEMSKKTPDMSRKAPEVSRRTPEASRKTSEVCRKTSKLPVSTTPTSPESSQKYSKIPKPSSAKASPKFSGYGSPKVTKESKIKSGINHSNSIQPNNMADKEVDEILELCIVEPSPAAQSSFSSPAHTCPTPPSSHSTFANNFPPVAKSDYYAPPLILDIPPDDISAEDEKFRMDVEVNLDELPPPPDELLEDTALPPPSVPQDFPAVPSLLMKDQDPFVLKNTLGMFPASVTADDYTATSDSDYKISIIADDTSDTTSVHSMPEMCTGELGDDHEERYVTYDMDSPPRSAPPIDQNGESIVIGMVVSRSDEKMGQTKSSSGVRNSKSHENYLECNADPMTLMDIDFEDNMASSVDALHYKKSDTSLDSVGANPLFTGHSRSLDNSPERRYDKVSEKVLMPTFISLEEPKNKKNLKEGGKLKEPKVGVAKDACLVTRLPGRILPTTVPEVPEEQNTPDTSEVIACNPPLICHALSEESSTDTQDTVEASSPAADTNTPRNIVQLPKEVSNENDNNNITVSQTSSNVSNKGSPARKEKKSTVEQATSSPPVSPYKGLDNSPSGGAATSSPTKGSKSKRKAKRPSNLEKPLQSHQPEEPYALSSGHVCTDTKPPSPEAQADVDSLYHQPIKEVDKPSAERLAKRLFHLDGFKKKDISKHLGKKNDFAQTVGEHYLSHFDFSNSTLDEALRKFLQNITLAGETQERERVLYHFSKRFMSINPGSYNSEDACHTLTCALMLLNTDLHGQNIGRKMTVNEFIENLADLNDGENYQKEVLKQLYHAIQTEPLQCEFDEADEYVEGGMSMDAQRYLNLNPFLDIPDPSKTVEFKKGYVMRKCCLDPDGRRTAMGKRGWKMFYATLRDMIMYLHKDEHGLKKGGVYASMSNAIRVHHALATKASDYKKKQHVLRVQTADWAQYLFQTSDSTECQEWMDTINLAAASLSAPPLPGAVGSQRKFQRPLMPSTYTKYNLREQLNHHEQRLQQLDRDLHEHRRFPPEKGAKSRVIHDYCDKESYLQFEMKRFKTYSFLLQAKMTTFPELEPSLVEVAIGEVDEPPASPALSSEHCPPSATPTSDNNHPRANTATADSTNASTKTHSSKVERSLSDRYSYRAAIYTQHNNELD